MSGSQGATNIEATLRAANANKPAKAAWNDVVIRPFATRDIEPLLNFYYRSSRESALMRSINFEVWPQEDEYRQLLNEVVVNPSKMPMVSVEYKGRTVGVHLLLNLQDGQADFQANFWQSQDCGKGIGSISWYKACQYFFQHFNYDTIYFRAPKDNAMSSAAAKKLPLNFIGEEELNVNYLKPGIRARIYSLTRSEFESMNSSQSETDDEEENDL